MKTNQGKLHYVKQYLQKQKTKVFFLLALRNDTLHVRWLSRLAWIARSPGRLNQLMEADSAETIYKALIEASESLPKSLAPTGQAMGR